MIIVLAGLLALGNLGARHFWGDETNQLFFSQSILRHGIPVVDDYVRQHNTLFETNSNISENVISYYSARVGGIDLYSAHPWLVAYIAAVPMALAGPFSEFFIRLPFVLIGLLAIPATFFLALRISRDRRVALLSALLLGFSTVYLLALRNTLYYGIVLFVVPAMLLAYLKTINKEKSGWWQFLLAGIVLFHSQWLVFIGTMLGIAVHFMLFNCSFEKLKRVVPPLAAIFALTFPWFILTGQLSKASVLSTPVEFIALLSIAAYHFIVWFVPVVFLLFVPFLVFARGHGRWCVDDGYALLVLVAVATPVVGALNYFGGTPIRYFYGILPLAMILNSAIISRLWQWRVSWLRAKKVFVIALVILLVATNFVHVLPLMPFRQVLVAVSGLKNVLDTGVEAQQNFVIKTLQPRILIAEYLYEITHPVISPTQAIIDEIKRVPRAGMIFVAAGDANAISYYTGLQPATYQYKFNANAYDWVSLPAKDVRNSDMKAKEYVRVQFPYAFDKWGDTADPSHHWFSTREGNGFFLYRRK